MEFAVYTWLYLSLVSLVGGIVVFSLLAFIASGFLFAFASIEDMEWVDKALTAVKISGGILLVSASLNAFLPTSDGVKLIAAAYVLGEGSKLEGVDKLPQNIVDALNYTLEQIKEKK